MEKLESPTIKDKSFIVLFHIVLPLIVGGLIYILFRPKHIVMFHVIELTGISTTIDQFRDSVKSWPSFLPGWVIFSLPNALWLYSMSVFLALVWNLKAGFKFWITTAWIFAYGMEVLQYFHIVPGTFSITDLVTMVLAGLFFLLFTTFFLKKINKQ